MKKQHEAFPRLGRRDWLKGCAAGALCLGGCASLARRDRDAYSVVLLGDTHYDTFPSSTYHTHYDNDRKSEWLWRVQRAEFMRNGDMWAERCPRLLKASAACLPSDARFVLQLGDLVQGDCDDQPTHKRMLDDAMQLMKRAYAGRLPFVAVEGNHDIRGDGACEAYHAWSNATMGRELGQTVESTTYSFRQGSDAWVVVDFNCPDPERINRLVDETEGARHLFLVTHGPLVFSDSGSFRWSLLGAPKYNETRRALIAKLMRRHAIVLAGHTHVIDFKRLKSAEGELTQFITSAVWTDEEMAFSKPVATAPDGYGTITAPLLTDDRARADFRTCIGEVAPNLREYWLARAAGHVTLSVSDRSVKATFYPGDARTPSQMFELSSARA